MHNLQKLRESVRNWWTVAFFVFSKVIGVFICNLFPSSVSSYKNTIKRSTATGLSLCSLFTHLRKPLTKLFDNFCSIRSRVVWLVNSSVRSASLECRAKSLICSKTMRISRAEAEDMGLVSFKSSKIALGILLIENLASNLSQTPFSWFTLVQSLKLNWIKLDKTF